MWYRVFSPLTNEVPPSAIVEHLHERDLPIEPHFKGDDLGWTQAELFLPGGGTPLMVARYLTKEDELRKDLNAYAAELETLTYSPNYIMLMEKVIQTQQLMTIRKPFDHADEVSLEKYTLTLIRFLAEQLQAVYQIDGQGWFAATGERLIEEY